MDVTKCTCWEDLFHQWGVVSRKSIGTTRQPRARRARKEIRKIQIQKRIQNELSEVNIGLKDLVWFVLFIDTWSQ